MGVAALFYYHGHTTNGNAHWRAGWIGDPHDTKFIMEKIGIHIKLQQYFQYWLNISELEQRDF